MNKCVLWTGAVTSEGYGNEWYKGTQQRPHRVAWMKANGPIPDGMDVHHICHTRLCINLEHLELVSHTDHPRVHRSDTCRTCGGTNWRSRKNHNGKTTRYCGDCQNRRNRSA